MRGPLVLRVTDSEPEHISTFEDHPGQQLSSSEREAIAMGWNSVEGLSSPQCWYSVSPCQNLKQNPSPESTNKSVSPYQAGDYIMGWLAGGLHSGMW